MTSADLNFMCDDAKQKHYYKMLRKLIYEDKMDPYKVLGISESNRYYAEKVAKGLCKITPLLGSRIRSAYHGEDNFSMVKEDEDYSDEEISDDTETV